MLHKNLKVLKRSISEKILRRSSQKIEEPATVSTRVSGSSSQSSSQDEDDPYQEILRTYNDNVSHLVFHGSSLKSMSNMEFQSMNHPINRHSSSSLHVHYNDMDKVSRGRTAKSAITHRCSPSSD
ncbi:hypothetical protein Q1695_006576 [Nippostrongylus brasiliensis]|nr:hypothetical protein Q1695_006576 [Nippostrongylus brasiliensis]